MSKDGLRKGILQILLANILNMAFSIGTNFLLPKFLSIDSYSEIKTYQLYITYVAIMHFGYNDGMYLKFGGKNIDEVNNEQLQRNISTLKIFQFVVMICSVSLAIWLHDTALLMAAIAILPQNIIAYFKNFYQAIGEFKRYSRIMNMTTGLTFAINLFLIAFVKTDNYLLYLIGYVALSTVLWLVLEHSLVKVKQIKIFAFCFSWKELKENIASGILLLMGNFSSQLLTSMDRWFVKGLIGSVAFAQYAFAVSMENFLNVVVSPVSVTMFNYFCKHDEREDILKIREMIIAFSTIIVASAFPIKFILEVFLQQYLDSVTVVFLLFSAQIYYIIIKSVYVNLYKARKMQRKYFSKLCIIVIVAFIFNVLCFAVYRKKESFAIGTLLSAIIWFFLCQLDFKELQYSLRHYIYIIVEMVTFIICGICCRSVIGCAIYIAVTILMLLLFMPYSLRSFVRIGKDAFRCYIK